MSDTRASVTVDDLLRDGLIAPADVPALSPVAQDFRIRLTPAMRGASTSPGVARQFVPDTAESITRPEELTDPIGDRVHSPTPGLTHRYPDRVILAVTQSCEVYCRFCFRRETVGATGTLPQPDLDAALDYIRATPAIHEVILTGGDPLTLSPRRLRAIAETLATIPHVDILRLHTRIPVVAPDRITDGMIAALTSGPTAFLVLHTNHADELTPAATAALGRLADAGIPLLSQTVLLRGVNDDADTLAQLFRALVRNRVKPYYLHHCDLARGTSHFRTTIVRGQEIMAELRGRISGMCLPTYVLDIPGGFGKVPIGPQHVTPGAAPGSYTVIDPQGRSHSYADPDPSRSVHNR